MNEASSSAVPYSQLFERATRAATDEERERVMAEIEPMLQAEAARRGVGREIRPARAPATLFGDRIQIQQVLINLCLHARDAVVVEVGCHVTARVTADEDPAR